MNQKMPCLIIHGFAGTTYDVEPLADHLRARGHRVVCSRLPGHTGDPADMAAVDHRDWLRAVEQDLVGLNASIVSPASPRSPSSYPLSASPGVAVIGFSMGGLLAVNLAAKCPSSVGALVLLNTPIYYVNVRQGIRNILSDLQRRERLNLRRYRIDIGRRPPIIALKHFVTLLRETKPLIPLVTCPALICQADLDDTVRPQSADFILRRIASEQKQVRRYAHSGHVICHGPDAAPLFEDVSGFLEALG